MTRHTPIAPALSRSSTRWPASLADPWPTGATGDDDCRIVTATIAIAFDLARAQREPGVRHAREAILAYQVAMYLAHVAFGLSMARIAQAFRRHRTTVTHACHLIEDRRDDPRFDRFLDSLEQAATALRTAYHIHHQR